MNITKLEEEEENSNTYLLKSIGNNTKMTTPNHSDSYDVVSDAGDVKFANGKKSKDTGSHVVDISEVDSKPKNLYASKKSVAEGMMDIALLTANANQLRFLITYNQTSKTFYISVGLITISLIIQIAVGIALIFKRQMKIKGKRDRADRTNDFLVVGVFLVTVINVFAASFTMTDSAPDADVKLKN